MKNQWIKFVRKIITKKLNEKPKEVFFEKVSIVDKTPELNQIADGEFVEVVYKGMLYWAIFKCPCGCSNVISLPLLKTKFPHWKVSRSKNGRPTVYPSIRQNKGCLSHFWIEDGKIEWCLQVKLKTNSK